MNITLKYLIVFITVGLGSLSADASVLWSEDFEGATVGSSSMSGTEVQMANTASGIIVDSTTDPVAAAAFTLASGKFVLLSTGDNAFTAVRSSLNPISFTQLASTNTYTLSFDIYIPSNLSFAVGDIQPRFNLNGIGGNGATDNTYAKAVAGQHHIVYTGLISDFIGTDVNEVRPFIGIDQATAPLADFMYMDNIHFELATSTNTPPPNSIPPLNTTYFASLQAGEVTSTPLVQWQQFGPGMSGYIDKFWINNGDPNAMYDQLDMGNNHVTLNRGEFWTSHRDIDGNGDSISGTTWMEFSHQNPDFGMMIAKNAFYTSNDRGRTWQFLIDEDSGSSQKHNVLSVDPNNDNNWYIGAGQGWMIKHTHYNQTGIVIDSRNHSAGFIMYSKNKGMDWTRVYSPFPEDSTFSRIIVDPRNSNHVYASSQYGVYKSTNGGVSWSLTTGTGLPHHSPRDMASFYDQTEDKFYLYIVEITHYTTSGSEILTSGGVYRSEDGGTAWDNLTGDLGIDFTQISTFSGGWNYHNRYYRAVAFWLETTSADIQTNYNLPTHTFSQFHTIAVDPNNKDRIYLCHNPKHDKAFPPGNIWQTDNGGTNWYASAREGDYWATETDKTYWESRAVQPLGINTKFAHVEKEHNGAGNNHITTGPRFLVVNAVGEVYTAFAQQVMRSIDNGTTWNQIDDDETVEGSGHWVGRGNCNLPGETFYLDTGTPGTYLWAGGEHGLWRNMHDGDLVYPGAISVKQLVGQSIAGDDPTSISTIAIHPTDSNRIYTLQFRQDKRGQLRYSSNAGSTWSTISTPVNFPASNDVIDQRSLIIDPENPSIMYFCIPRSEWDRWSAPFTKNGPDGWTGHGIFKSTNGGVSFSAITNGIPPGSSVYRMQMDPADSQTIYAALNESHDGVVGGLYKTTDGGINWSAMNIPEGVVSVNSIKIHNTTGDFYIACGVGNDSASETGGGFISQDQGTSWHLLFDMPYLRNFVPSKADPNVIAVNVGKGNTVKVNPGCYVSIDGGANWHKINNRHGQPEGIRKIEADPYDTSVLWMSNHGTGFFKADISPLLTGESNEPFFWDWMEENGQDSMFVDTDLDGFYSQSEYVADTDPYDSNSFLRVDLIPSAGTDLGVSFDSALNRLYTVDYTDNLSSGWNLLTNGVHGTGSSIEILDTDTATNRFYRIHVELK